LTGRASKFSQKVVSIVDEARAKVSQIYSYPNILSIVLNEFTGCQQEALDKFTTPEEFIDGLHELSSNVTQPGSLHLLTILHTKLRSEREWLSQFVGLRVCA
jgi:hypothetical protein